MQPNNRPAPSSQLRLSGIPTSHLSNEIAKSSYNLSLTCHRLLKQFISELPNYYDKEVIPSDTFTLTSMQFAHLWGTSVTNARQELAKATKSLYSSEVFMGELTSSYYYGRWISDFSYDKPTDTWTITWSKATLAHITMLKERFIKLELTDMLELSSSYTYRLYEILAALTGENSFKNPKLPVEEWMYMLAVPDSCKVYKTFKARVLLPSITELNTKTSRFKLAGLREHKGLTGKKVELLEFTGVITRYKPSTIVVNPKSQPEVKPKSRFAAGLADVG